MIIMSVFVKSSPSALAMANGHAEDRIGLMREKVKRAKRFLKWSRKTNAVAKAPREVPSAYANVNDRTVGWSPRKIKPKTTIAILVNRNKPVSHSIFFK